jgi:putative endonuclease
LLLLLFLLLLFFLSFPVGNLLFAFALAFLASHSLRESTSNNLCYHPAMPRREYHFWVYILSSRSRNLYIGMTNSLIRRTATHREQLPGTHTGHYVIHRLVYFEYFQYVRSAIAREKQLKHWTREQKIELIERVNPTWEDLYPTLQERAISKNSKSDSLRECQQEK